MMFKLAVTAGLANVNESASDWSRIPADARAGILNGQMARLAELNNYYRNMGPAMSPEEAAAVQKQIAEASADLRHAHRAHYGAELEQYTSPYAARGQVAPTPRGPSLMHRISNGRFGTGRVGPEMHRERDVAKLLGETEGIIAPPSGVRGWWKGLGTAGKLGVGAAGVIGGGMLLNKLMGNGDQRRSPAGY